MEVSYTYDIAPSSFAEVHAKNSKPKIVFMQMSGALKVALIVGVLTLSVLCLCQADVLRRRRVFAADSDRSDPNAVDDDMWNALFRPARTSDDEGRFCCLLRNKRERCEEPLDDFPDKKLILPDDVKCWPSYDAVPERYRIFLDMKKRPNRSLTRK
uniref:TAP-C domain-containing protein n=1 Tax=Romanomermis culicivorax TaxID=13658 RepID=A0A915JXZ6_ROMCU